MTDMPIQDSAVSLRESDLLYSRADPDGTIRTGNDEFFWASGHDRSDLIGAPHSRLRHPDMPRAVFHVEWARLKEGKSVVSYIKNKAADGRYYWVLSMITPVSGGYIATKILPRAPHLERVKPIYAELLKREAAGATPEESAEHFFQEIRNAGYDTMCDYMVSIMRDELLIRYGERRSPQVEFLRNLPKMQSTLDAIAEEQSNLVDVFNLLHRLPTNMRIMASRLETSGGPVSAVSESYRVAVADILESLKAVGRSGKSEEATDLGGRLLEADFAVCSYLLLRECLERISEKTRRNTGGLEQDMALLTELTDTSLNIARDHLRELSTSAQMLGRNCGKLRNKMVGLDQIRIMGEIESGRLRNQTELSVLMEQLGTSHEGIRGKLLQLINVSADLHSQASRISF